MAGAGSISQLGPERWRVQISTGRDPATGKYPRVTRVVRGTRDDAERVRAELLLAHGDGSHVDGRTMTVGQLVGEWWPVKVDQIAARTRIDWRYLIDRYLLVEFGAIRVADIDARRLDRTYRRMVADGVGRPTVAKVHQILSVALTQAVRWAVIPMNPCTLVTPPAVEARPDTVPDRELVGRLLEHIDRVDEMLGVFCRIAVGTGMRRGEIGALMWPRVNLEDGSVTVSGSVSDQAGAGGGVLVKGTKTGRVRVLALPAPLVDVLLRWRDVQAAEAGRAGVELSACFVVADRLTVPTAPNRWTTRFRRARAGVVGAERVRLNDLRHFHATALISSGVDVATVSNRLGHASARMTLDVYAHVVPAADREAASTIADYL